MPVQRLTHHRRSLQAMVGQSPRAVKKFGLQMRNGKSSAEFLVIDHVERPLVSGVVLRLPVCRARDSSQRTPGIHCHYGPASLLQGLPEQDVSEFIFCGARLAATVLPRGESRFFHAASP
jgi:hypothetical protein